MKRKGTHTSRKIPADFDDVKASLYYVMYMLYVSTIMNLQNY